MTAEPFDQLMGDLDNAMVIVTAAAEGERSGCLVGFSTQCSIDPPRFAVFISRANHTFGVARRATHLAVHLLSPQTRDLAVLFGTETGDEVDKFAGCAWHPGPGGAPVLDDVGTWFAGTVHGQVDAGDHVAFVLDPVEAHRPEPLHPLGFQQVRDLDAGHDA